jgi:hypothetical protein
MCTTAARLNRLEAVDGASVNPVQSNVTGEENEQTMPTTNLDAGSASIQDAPHMPTSVPSTSNTARHNLDGSSSFSRSEALAVYHSLEDKDAASTKELSLFAQGATIHYGTIPHASIRHIEEKFYEDFQNWKE